MRIEWNKVTWYSKAVAVVLFVGTFFLGFCLGTMNTEKVYVQVPYASHSNENIIPNLNSGMSEAEARAIANKTCIKGGEALAAGTYNENSKTWWFDANLNSATSGCHPACVVSEETKQAEINSRCTGANAPE